MLTPDVAYWCDGAHLAAQLAVMSPTSLCVYGGHLFPEFVLKAAQLIVFSLEGGAAGWDRVQLGGGGSPAELE